MAKMYYEIFTAKLINQDSLSSMTNLHTLDKGWSDGLQYQEINVLEFTYF